MNGVEVTFPKVEFKTGQKIPQAARQGGRLKQKTGVGGSEERGTEFGRAVFPV